MKAKKSQNRKRAEALLKSERGKYLLSQALHVAANDLIRDPSPNWSNAADMLLLRNELYPLHTIAIGRGVLGIVRRARKTDPPMSPSGKEMLIEAWKTREGGA